VGLGAVRRATGDVQESVRLEQRALELYRGVQNRIGKADALDELGAAVGATGDFAGAEALLTRALDLYRKFELGESEEAVSHLRTAVAIYHTIGAAEATATAQRLAEAEDI
jgi:tetratricopeptide (TPR) repeat protein